MWKDAEDKTKNAKTFEADKQLQAYDDIIRERYHLTPVMPYVVDKIERYVELLTLLKRHHKPMQRGGIEDES